MKFSDVELFLSIYKNKNLTKAANSLYMSQSTVSHRLNLLENEIGAPLFIRNKGYQNIELTPCGEEFLSIAQQYILLQEEVKNIGQKKRRLSLRIAGVHTLNNYVLSPFYQRLYSTAPNLELYLSTHHSWEIYKLMDNRELDIGFVNNNAGIQHLNATPILKEAYCVLVHESKYLGFNTISPQMLSPENELFHSYSPEYKQWHDNTWSPSKNCVVHVNETTMLEPFLVHPDYWTILPLSVAKVLSQNRPLKILYLSSPPPDRYCYMLTPNSSSACSRDSIQIFMDILHDFLKECPFSCLND